MRKLMQSLKRSKLGKSTLAIVLAFSVLLTTFSGMAAIFVGAAQWDGSTASSFESGTGTQDDPFMIADGAQLKYLITLGAEATKGKYYQLADDIYLNPVSSSTWYEASGLNQWPVLDNLSENAFCGNFNGAGHVVYGIYVKDTTAHADPAVRDFSVGAGLFPVLGGGATVDAVGVEKAYISITNACSEAASKYSGIAGAIAGATVNHDATNTIQINRCYAGDSVRLEAAAVGLIGGNSWKNGTGITVKNCYSLLAWATHTAEDENNRAGIIGYFGGGAVISGCFGLGNVAGTIVTKGEANNYVTAWSSNAGTSVSSSDIYGGEAAMTAMPELDWDNAYMATSSHPVLRVFNVKATEGITVWNGTEAAPNQGSGTEADPYVIKTAENLAYAVANFGGNGKYYVLANDIYLNDVAMINWKDGTVNGSYTPNEWFASYEGSGTSYDGSSFKGSIDGAGFTIYGLYYRPGSVNTSAALLPVANNSTVKNLRIANAFVSGGRWNATLVGYGSHNKFENIVIEDTVTVWGYNVGAHYIDQTAINKHMNGEGEWTFYYDKTEGKYASFQSTGTGVIIGYASGSVTVKNVAEYSNIKTTGFNFTVENDLINGGNPVAVNENGHMGSIIGTAWNTTINVSDSLTLNRPFDNGNGSTAVNSWTNVYSVVNDKNVNGVTVVAKDHITGETAKSVLTGLNFNTTWATTTKYPTLMIFSRMDPSEYWSGDAVQPTEGEGTPEKPFIISTPEELAYIVKNGTVAGAHYQLANDIYLNDVTMIDWATGTVKAGYVAKEWFTTANCGVLDGTIDGNGHVVYGLYSNVAGNFAWGRSGGGLFPYVGANKVLSVSKLGVDLAYVRNPNGASAFTATTAVGGTFAYDQCFAGSNVYLTGNDAGTFYAVGSDGTFCITNCYTHATTSAKGTAGLLGDVYSYDSDKSGFGCTKSTLTNCYNSKGAIAPKGHRILNYSNNYATAKSYSEGATNFGGETVLTEDQMQGLSVVTTGAMSGLGDKFQGTTTFPILAAFSPVAPAPEAGVWDGVTKTAPTVGFGTADQPYMIHNAAELAYVVAQSGAGNSGKYYKLANDIYLNEIDKVNWATGEAIDGYKINTWLGNGGLGGNLDGDGYAIYGLYFKYAKPAGNPSGTAGYGLFPAAYNGFEVKNLYVDYAYTEAYTNYSFGVLFGAMSSTVEGKVTYTAIGENVYAKGFDAGAFFGGGPRKVNLTIDHCYSLATVEGTNRFGAFYADSWANPGETGYWVITNSYSLGKFSHAGGNKMFNNVYSIGSTVAVDKVTNVTLADATGLNVFNNGKPMQGLNGDKAYQATDKYPILDIFAEDPNGPDGEEYVPETDEDANGIWKGVVAGTYSDNTSKGTKDDPIVLATAGELALAISSGGAGKYYKLSKDMYLNDINVKGWFAKEDNNKWFTNVEFSGHIDGAGHIVYGLWYPATTSGDAGFIPRMITGSVTNLGLRYGQVQSTSANGVGGLIGWAKDVITVEKCFVDETVTVAGGACTGGIVGLAQQNNWQSDKGLVIRDCYSKVSIMANNNKTNGLIGNPWVTYYEIYNSYSIGERPYHNNGGGGKSTYYWKQTMKYDEDLKTWVTDVSEAKPGKNAADIFKNIYSDVAGADNVDLFWTKVDNELMYGNDASKYMSGLDFTNVWKTNKDGTPTLRVFGDKVDGKDIDTSADAQIYSSGSGKKSDPYIIETAAQLKYLVTSTTTAGKYYKLANDIYVNDTSKSDWKVGATVWPTNLQSSAFSGHLEGNGHSVYGLYVNETPAAKNNGQDYIGGTGAGLFPYAASGAVIRNVHVRNSYISGYGNVGGIVGHTSGNSNVNVEIVGCSVDESVTLRGFTVGGLVGTAFPAGVSIYFCYATADVDGNAPGTRVNGIMGDTWSGKCNIMQTYTMGNPPTRGGVSGQSGANYSDISGPSFKAVPTANMYGTAAKKAMPELKWDVVWYTVNGKTPQLKVVGEDVYAYEVDEGVKGRVWQGGLASKFAGGTGTEEDPYLIETPEQLAYLASKGGSTNNTYYKITADLKLNNTSKAGWEQNALEWFSGTPVFRGHLDGGYHVVTGLFFDQTDASYCAIFSNIGRGASVKRLGVATSTITNNASNLQHTYCAAIAAGIENFDGYMGANWDGNMDTVPLFEECFIAPDVTVTGDTPGGILGGGAAGVKFLNCYACPTINASYRGAGLYGDLWEGGESYVIIENCYVATTDRDGMGTGPKYSEQIAVFINAYVDGSTSGIQAGGIKGLNLFYMQGERVKEHMPGLDYNKVWKIVTTGETGGTPVLRGFANAEKYSNTREPMKVSIEFVTGDGGSKHDPVWGYPMVTEVPYDEFPTPTRYGYKFDGWYHYDSCDLEFDLDYFPNYNCYAYAKWVQVGFTNGFEGSNSPEYDINEGVEFFQPGVAGYNPKYIHGGLRSLHTLPDSATAPMFLLGYETKLEVGVQYDVNFWMAAKEDGASGSITVIHSNYADVNDEVVGAETGLEFTDLKGGEWKQYRITVTANGPYLMFQTTPGVELFFDDFQVVPVDGEGQVGNIDSFNPSDFGEPFSALFNWILGFGVVGIILLVVGGIVLVVALAAIVIAVVLIVRKSKKKKALKAAAAAAPVEEAPSSEE